MSFVAGRTVVVLGAVTTQYVVEIPKVGDGNYQTHGRHGHRHAHIEIANMTGDLVFLAWDRAVVPPSGNGVQGSALPPALYPRTGPVAGTPGDFDLCISTANGWGALDITIPPNKEYVSIYTRAAGAVTVSFGDQL